MTYIGELRELKFLAKLRHCPGFEQLKKEIESKDWEEFESAFATAREAYNLLDRGLVVEFAPEVIVDGKKKSPDFRSKLINRWVYFEVKASSMFPSEKRLLKNEDQIRKSLDKISSKLKFIVKIYTARFSESQIESLSTNIEKEAVKLEGKVGTTFPQKYFYPSMGESSAEYIFLGYIDPAIYDDREFVLLRAAVAQMGDKLCSTFLKDSYDRKLLYMGYEDIDKFLNKLSNQLFGVPLKHTPAFSIIFNIIMGLSKESYYLIGQSPPYKPEHRIKNIIDDAWKQLPQQFPSVLILYTREVVLKMDEVKRALDNLFNLKRYAKISAVIVEMQLATGEKIREIFSNPNANHRLEEEEEAVLISLRAR